MFFMCVGRHGKVNVEGVFLEQNTTNDNLVHVYRTHYAIYAFSYVSDDVLNAISML